MTCDIKLISSEQLLAHEMQIYWKSLKAIGLSFGRALRHKKINHGIMNGNLKRRRSVPRAMFTSRYYLYAVLTAI